jgi:TP901 family phage tail tape measure protein
MSDRVSRFVIEFGGEDDASIRSVISAIKGQFRSAVTEIEASTKNIKLFESLEGNVQKTSAALAVAKKDVDGLKASIALLKGAGAGSTDALEKGLRSAQTELKAATREFDKSVTALTKVENALTRAGVDTANLAAEQVRLAEAARQANAVLVEQSTKALLGFKGLKDIQPQINQLNAAFLALRDSGKLSFGELSVAQARLQQQIGLLRAETGGLGQAFTNIRGSIIAFAAAFAGVTAGITQSAANFREFAQQVAALDSIADTSKANIDKLAGGVRALAKALGVDAVESTKALYEIISSGIPQENALTVLEQATKAAIAGLTDVKTAASVGVAVLNGYGLEVTQLGHVYDVLFQTVKDGVITFPELAKNIGTIIPAARAAKIPLEELGAAFVVLTRQGFDAPEAATAINRAIVDLSAPAPEAAQRLNDLGIAVNGLTGTIEQLASRNFNLSQIAQIVPDVRAQRAVLALISNFKLLRDELGAMNAAAGQTQAAYLKLANTPQQQVAKFNAAVKDLSISIGEFVTGSGGLVTSLTGMVNAFNALSPATKTAVLQFSAVAAGGAAIVLIARQLIIPLNLLAGALFQVGAGGSAAATGLTAAGVAMNGLKLAAAGFLGFKLGEQLSENFAIFRVIGDLVGTSAAAVVNFSDFAMAKLFAALTGNKKASDDATAAFQRNRAVIADQWGAAISGASERLRALDAEQTKLIDSLGKSSAAAVNAAGLLDTSVSKIAASVGAQLAGIDQFVTRLQGRLTQLSANLTQNAVIVQTLSTAAIANINANAAAQLAALDNLRNSELQVAAKTLAIQTKQAADRLAALQKEGAETIKAFEASAKARLDIAKRTGEDEKKVEQDIALARRAVLQSIVDANRAHINELIGQLTGYQNKVREIELSRVDFNRAAEDQIREIRAGNLTAYQKYRADAQEIDRLISEGRKSLAAGDAKLAEDYAKRAIAASASIAKAVNEGGQEIVSATSAQSRALAKVAEATKLGNDAFRDQGDAAKEGAAKTKTALESSVEELKSMQDKLDEVSKALAKGIEISITANTEAVTKTIAELDAKIAEQDHLLAVKADITLAQVEIKRLKDELDQGITVNVKGRTAEIEAALKRVAAEQPEITVDVTKALAAVGEVRTAAQAIENIHVQIESNAADVRKEIDSLNGRDTSSTHTIHIVKVNDNAAGGPIVATPLARGGPVGVQRFARGGSVFRRPTWHKVPGSGSGDTVPAALRPGSFVLRKAASAYYGDSLLGRLARGYASGGLLGGTPLPRSSGLSASRGTVQAAPNDDFWTKYKETIAQLRALQEASIGAPRPRSGEVSLGTWAGTLVEDFVFYSDLHRQQIRKMLEESFDGWLAGIGVAKAFHLPNVIDGQLRALMKRYAGGGMTDTVPAMLTPGEYVIRPQAVAKYGGGLMHALNNMQVPRGFLAGMLDFPAPRPAMARVAHFAEGGPVGSQTSGATRGGAAIGGGLTVNIYAQSVDAETVRRDVIPLIDKVMKRGR